MTYYIFIDNKKINHPLTRSQLIAWLDYLKVKFPKALLDYSAQAKG